MQLNRIIAVVMTISLFVVMVGMIAGAWKNPAVFQVETKSAEHRDLSQIIESKHWNKTNSDSINFGYSSGISWVRFPADQITSQSIIDLNFSQLDYVDIYIVNRNNNAIAWHKRSGDRYTYEEKQIPNEKVQFLVDQPDIESDVYIALESGGSVQARLEIKPTIKHLSNSDSTSNLVHFFAGFVCFAILFYWISYRHFDKKLFAFFALTGLSMVLFEALYYKTFLIYATANIELQHDLLLLMMMCVIVFSMLYAESVLVSSGVDSHSKRIKTSVGLLVILMVSSLFLSYQTSLVLSFILFGAISIDIMRILSLEAWRSFKTQGSVSILGLWAGWTILFAGNVTQIASELGLIGKYSHIANHGMLVGSIGILISMGFNYSTKIEQRTEEEKQSLKELAISKERLYQAERVASLNSISSGLAHEIKNPLAWAKSSMEILRKKADDKEHRDRYINRVEAAVYRINEIISGLNWFMSTSQLKEKSWFCFEEAIQKTLSLAKSDLNDIQVDISVDKNLMMLGSRIHISQVVMNLLTNSIKAIKKNSARIEKGHIEIAVREEEGIIVLTWRDNGVGMSNDERDRLFSFFYTTDPEADGKGLGATIIAEIVARHGGTISVTSEQWNGALFEIRLPIERNV